MRAAAPETPNLARSILLAGLGLLCVAMVLVPGQNMWKTLRGGLFGIFGVMTYLVGPFLLYLAYLLPPATASPCLRAKSR